MVIIWLLDLELPMQSVPITTNVASLNPANGEVYSIQHYVTSKDIPPAPHICPTYFHNQNITDCSDQK